ncbi:rhodopsin-like g-protein coupled receptor protein signaling pathway [Leptolyngbya sp. Heron Island J]|uniref:type II toxin-antitoxin system RelN family antitoxin n=1 Tax=Leptolyngbya sp. Heron Island J TaxID=1385935 RepID=UPI0003B98891|nr:hypothetical protein [Leptolyngbya sp. Heron Island J]ESA32412.1 rhodopsin-like g-protein coupled receptor protein signaling pathway [Leptolyngbya sp. Heron Island J]
MKAIETTATIDEQGQLSLDRPLMVNPNQRVRVIVLIAEADEPDPDDTPDAMVLEGLKEGLEEALAGQTIPVANMWDGIDAE